MYRSGQYIGRNNKWMTILLNKLDLNLLVALDAMLTETSIAAQPDFTPATSVREFSLLVSDYALMTLIPCMIKLASQESDTIRFQLLTQVESQRRALQRGKPDIPKVSSLRRLEPGVDLPSWTLSIQTA